MTCRYNGSVRFRIRPYQKSDFEILWQIDQICFEPLLAYSRPELAVYMRRAGSFTLVAESEESSVVIGNANTRIIGFIVCDVQRRSGHVITIDVMPEARRGGVGSALMDAAEEKLRAMGATRVELETAVDNMAAIQFYKGKGYFVEDTIRGYYSNQLDALVMRKELTPVTA